MSNDGYPVIEERALGRAGRRLFGGRREPAELPPQQPGTVLVFEADGRFEVLADRHHLSGREMVVVNAVSVSVVDVRARLVTVDINVPSMSAADDFTIRMTYQCRVTQPQVVASAGIIDLTPLLRGHLGRDRELARHCGSHPVDDITDVRQWVTARVAAYCQLQPPRVDGMSISFAEVSVLTPQDLRQHATGLRDEVWRQLREEPKIAFENRDVERIEAIMRRGAEALSALAISRGQLNLSEAAEREYRINAEKRRDLLEMARILGDGHHLDTAPIDVMPFINAFAEQAIGKIREGQQAQLDGSTPRPSLTKADQDVPRVVDEEELLG